MSKHKLKTRQNGIEVDRKAGIIRNVAIITAGPANGHGFRLDARALQTIAKLINDAGGVPSRAVHPKGEGLLMTVGVVGNARVVDGVVRGDVDLTVGASSPMGDMREFFLSMAEAIPGKFGLSAVLADEGFDMRDGQRFIRVAAVDAVDFTDLPAANPAGLLSQRAMKMNEQQLAELRKLLGLADDASVDDIFAAVKAASDAPADEPAAETAAALSARNGGDVLTMERKRVAGLRRLATTYKLGEGWALRHAENNTPIAMATRMAEELSMTRIEGLALRTPGIGVGEDQNRATFSEGMSDAIALRFNPNLKNPSPRAQQFRGMRTHELARLCLAEAGVATDGYSPARLIESALRTHRHKLAQSTSDFDGILADGINKTLRNGYIEAPSAWQIFCRRATAQDFKTIRRPGLGALPTPTERNEGGGLTYVNISDSDRTYLMREFAQGLKLTWRALVGDDLDSFGRLTAMQGAACRRLEDDVAFASFLTGAAGPTMPDGYALFENTHHANIISSGSGAPSVATIAALAVKLGLQTSGTAVLNLTPKFLICPLAIGVTAQQVVSSAVDPSKSNDTPNPFAGKLVVIQNARLDADDTAAWYLFTDPAECDTVEVCFLESMPAPELKQEQDWDTDDYKLKVKHCVAACAIDYRGMARTSGTA